MSMLKDYRSSIEELTATTPKKKAAAAKLETPTFEGLIRSRDAARLLGMSEWLLRKLAHEGDIPYLQITPRSPMLFDLLDLRGWIERQKIRK